MNVRELLYKSRRMIRAVLALALTIAILSGCGLLPKEEDYSRAPIIAEEDTEQYVMAKVMRGDITVTDVVRASFIPSASEKLSFSIGGERIAHVYVSVGDEVKAGDLLIELDISTIEAEITAQNDQIEQLNMSLSHLYSSWAIDLEQAQLQDEQAKENNVSGWSSRETAVSSNYYTQITSVSNQLEVANARLTELEAEKEKRQLRASIDGIVSQMSDFYKGERSVKGREVITIVDMEEALFEVYSSNSGLLKDGETYVLVSGKKEYTVTCCLGKDLDFPSVKENGVYLRLDVPDPELKKGESGSVTIIVQEETGTLFVPVKAVQTVQGQTVVYVPDDQGFRQMKEVTVGISNGTVIEIRSGLEEGDTIILP